MTVSTQYAPLIFIGDGTQDSWPVNYRIFSRYEVRAGLAGSYGIIAPLIYGSGYTVDANSDGSGGMVRCLVPAGAKLVIWLETDIIQPLDLTPKGPLDAESAEVEYDRGAIIDQELFEKLSRAILVPIGSDLTPDELLRDIFSARDEAVESAERAKMEADRASKAADVANLNSYARNVRRLKVLSSPIPSGGLLTLPGIYYPKRDILYLSVNGMVCSPKEYGALAAGAYQYEEVGNDENVPSDQVRIYFPLQAGDLIDVWVVASNLMKELAAISAMAQSSADSAASAAGYLAQIMAVIGRAGITGNGELVSQGNSGRPYIAAGGLFNSPLYVAGANQLSVYLEGCRCLPGVHYQEIGAVNSANTSIRWLVDVPTEFAISIYVTPGVWLK